MKRYLLSLISLFTLISYAGAAKPILIVVTNHDQLAETGTPTGYFLSEVAHPWHVFTQAGYEVEFASPKGGFAPMDPKSFDLSDSVNKTFWHDLDAVQRLLHSQALAKLDPKAYAAIFFAGGHGTMWDFPNSKTVRRSIAKHYKSGGVIGAVCHGPAALIGVKIDGVPLVKGKTVTGFTDDEEAAVKLTQVVPFLLESELRKLGANFQGAENFTSNVAVSERLVTGQNPASATATAKAILKLIN